MKRIILFGIFLTSLLIFSACSNDSSDLETNEGDYLIFGTFNGECFGQCTNLYKVDEEQIFEDDLNIGLPEDIPFKSEPMENSKFELAKQLKENFPNELLESSERTYGCPDCSDQGGIYLELRRDGDINKWTIDTDDTDQEEFLLDYKQQIKVIMNQL